MHYQLQPFYLFILLSWHYLSHLVNRPQIMEQHLAVSDLLSWSTTSTSDTEFKKYSCKE
jgi:hypothetical protein